MAFAVGCSYDKVLIQEEATTVSWRPILIASQKHHVRPAVRHSFMTSNYFPGIHCDRDGQCLVNIYRLRKHRCTVFSHANRNQKTNLVKLTLVS